MNLIRRKNFKGRMWYKRFNNLKPCIYKLQQDLANALVINVVCAILHSPTIMGKSSLTRGTISHGFLNACIRMWKRAPKTNLANSKRVRFADTLSSRIYTFMLLSKELRYFFLTLLWKTIQSFLWSLTYFCDYFRYLKCFIIYITLVSILLLFCYILGWYCNFC